MTAPRLYRRRLPTLLGVLALAASAPAEPAALGKADRILILKSERQLTLYREGKPLKTYLVALGGSPVGDKQCQGDQRTPEGTYRIELKNKASRFHLSLRVSYPDATDKAEARKRGCSPGGDIDPWPGQELRPPGQAPPHHGLDAGVRGGHQRGDRGDLGGGGCGDGGGDPALNHGD